MKKFVFARDARTQMATSHAVRGICALLLVSGRCTFNKCDAALLTLVLSVNLPFFSHGPFVITIATRKTIVYTCKTKSKAKQPNCWEARWFPHAARNLSAMWACSTADGFTDLKIDQRIRSNRTSPSCCCSTHEWIVRKLSICNA